MLELANYQAVRQGRLELNHTQFSLIRKWQIVQRTTLCRSNYNAVDILMKALQSRVQALSELFSSG